MRLKHKILLLTIVPLTLVLFIIGGLTIYNKVGTETQLLLDRLSSYRVLLESGDLSFGTAADKAKLESFFDENVEFSEILGKNYKVIYSSENSAAPLVTEDEKKELDDAFQGYETTKNIGAREGRKAAFVIITPLVVNKRIVAVLHQGLSNERSSERIRQYTIYVIGSILAGIVVCFFLISFLLNKVILQNIYKLEKATTEIQNGNLDTQIEVKSNDEIGRLATMFGSMAEAIKAQRNALQEQIKELETKLKGKKKGPEKVKE